MGVVSDNGGNVGKCSGFSRKQKDIDPIQEAMELLIGVPEPDRKSDKKDTKDDSLWSPDLSGPKEWLYFDEL